jgi:hypothetical protein
MVTCKEGRLCRQEEGILDMYMYIPLTELASVHLKICLFPYFHYV